MKKMKKFKSTDLNRMRLEVLNEAVENGAILETGSSRHGKREPVVMISWSRYIAMIEDITNSEPYIYDVTQ